MIVNWKPQRLNVVPIGKGNGGNFVLKPGTNNVPGKIWEKIKPNLKKHLERGDLTIENVKEIEKEKIVKGKDGKEKIEKKKVTEAVSFEKLSPEKARKIIEECNDIDSLTKWREKETRDEVRALLKDRIDVIQEFIDTGKKPKKESTKKRGRK